MLDDDGDCCCTGNNTRRNSNKGEALTQGATETRKKPLHWTKNVQNADQSGTRRQTGKYCNCPCGGLRARPGLDSHARPSALLLSLVHRSKGAAPEESILIHREVLIWRFPWLGLQLLQFQQQEARWQSCWNLRRCRQRCRNDRRRWLRGRRRHRHRNRYVRCPVFPARLHGHMRRARCKIPQELLRRVVLDPTGPSKFDQALTLTEVRNTRPRKLASVFQLAFPAFGISLLGKTGIPGHTGTALLIPGWHVRFFFGLG